MGLTDAASLLGGDNPLKSAISNISVPSTPGTPSITDFDNFSTGTACIEVSVKHTAWTLKLRGSHLGGEVIVDYITPILEAMLGMDNGFGFQIPELTGFNMDLGLSKLSNPQTGDLPQCLADTLTGKLSTRGPGMMGDILDPLNSAIGTANSYTSGANTYINSALSSFTGSMNDMVGAANSLLSSAMSNYVDPADKPLFEELERLSAYLEGTNYLNDYKDWRDLTRCIENNCKPLIDIIMRDDFLWHDELRTEFIMPVDMGNGRIGISKFFRDLTTDQYRKCIDIERRYYKYLQQKRAVAAKAAEQLRIAKIADNKNPFTSIVSGMSSTRDSIVNNLF